jgi:hypothetical protein
MTNIQVHIPFEYEKVRYLFPLLYKSYSCTYECNMLRINSIYSVVALSQITRCKLYRQLGTQNRIKD